MSKAAQLQYKNHIKCEKAGKKLQLSKTKTKDQKRKNRTRLQYKIRIMEYTKCCRKINSIYLYISVCFCLSLNE